MSFILRAGVRLKTLNLEPLGLDLVNIINVKHAKCNMCSSAEELMPNKGGFAKAYEKFASQKFSLSETRPSEESFLSLLKNSKFIDIGDPEGKVVTGTIFHVVEDDLYVDFGWKFHCVVSKPAKNKQEYVRGAKVRLSLKDLELSTRFLGSQKDLTLLEADATLIGIISTPAKPGS